MLWSLMCLLLFDALIILLHVKMGRDGKRPPARRSPTSRA